MMRRATTTSARAWRAEEDQEGYEDEDEEG